MLTVGFAGVVCVLMFLLVWIVNSFAKERVRAERTTSRTPLTMSAFGAENRQHSRVEIKWSVRIETAQGSKDGMTKDVSLGGAFISCSEPLPLGEIFPLTINAPGHEAKTVTAEVVWSNINVPEDKVVNRGMGIRFVQISDEIRKYLNEAISSDLDGRYAAMSSPHTSPQEKRKYPRAGIKWPVNMDTGLGLLGGHTSDISIGGAFISCSNALPVGEVFALAMNAPGREPMKVTAEVVWCNVHVPDDRIVNRGIGVRFIRLPSEVREFLDRTISAYLKE